jgi:hypothetical protein
MIICHIILNINWISHSTWFFRNKITINLVTYLDFTFPPVSSQRQVDSIYFDLISASDLVSHSILLHKLCAHGLFRGYVNWFLSYLTNRKSSARILDTFSLPFEVLSWVPQGSVLGPLLFNILINICNVTKHANYLLSADDVKIFRAINSVDDCILRQTDIECTRGWCTTNFIKFNTSKPRKTNVLYYAYIIWLFYNPYGHYQGPCSTTTSFKIASPRTCRLHFLSIHKDTGLNTNYNLFFFYPW